MAFKQLGPVSKIASACNTQQSYPALRKSTLFKQFSTVKCLNNYSIFFKTAIESPRVMGHIFELARFQGFLGSKGV